MEFTLDYATWRCGLEGDNRIGKGPTLLLNIEGYMCCLGQMALQLGLSQEQIRDKGKPSQVITEIPGFNRKGYDSSGVPYMTDTALSEKAMCINDDETTSPITKMILLTKLLERYGHTLQVINLTENETKQTSEGDEGSTQTA